MHFFLICFFWLPVNDLTAAQSQVAVTFEMKQATIEQVIERLESITGFGFAYRTNELPNTRKDYSFSNTSISQAMDEMLKGTNLGWNMEGNIINVAVRSVTPPQTPPSTGNVNIPTITITGKLTDMRGNPLAGAYVLLESSTFGAVTDREGNYSLRIPQNTSQDANIVFSYVGMETRKETLDGRTVINAALKESAQSVDEVIVTGYTTVNRRDMVGSYKQLIADSIIMPSYTSIDQMLQGQVSGMIVTNSSVRAGSSPKIQIRGATTLLGNTTPLWVVDGMIQQDVMSISGNALMVGNDASINEFLGSQISWLNPHDIETITVLKDASATALYGSRASNGVIVITTKKGKTDRVRVTYSNNFSVTQRLTYDDYYVMNSKERINFSKDATAAGAYYNTTPRTQFNTYEGMYKMYLAGDINEQTFIDQYNYLETVNTDWLKLLTRNAFSQNHTLSVSGASEKINFMVSASYANNKGIEVGNDSERMSARVRVGFQLHPKFRVDVSLIGTVQENSGYAAGVNPQSYALNTSRAIPAYEKDGSRLYYKTQDYYLFNRNTQDTGLDYNILNELDNTSSRIKSPQINANITLQWQLPANFTYELTAGYANRSRTAQSYAEEDSYYIVKNYRGYRKEPNADILSTSPEYKAALLPFGGQLATDITQAQSYTLLNTLRWGKTFNERHRVNAMVSWEVNSENRVSNFNTQYGYLRGKGQTYARPSNIEDLVAIGSANPGGLGIFDQLYPSGMRSTEYTENMLSGFGTFAYAYDNKYIVNANFRNDISNKFGLDVRKRFDPTYSFGLKWNMAEEEFMDFSRKWLDVMSFDITFGLQGLALTAMSPDMTFYSPKASTTYNQYVSTIAQLANPGLSWERTKNWNFGWQTSFFRGRLATTLEYYTRESNAVSNVQLPYEYGMTSPSVREGNHINNKGVEFDLSVIPFRNKDWTVQVSMNISKNWNRITKVVEDVNEGISSNSYINGQNERILTTGYSLGAFWAWKFTGLDPDTGYPTFYLPEPQTVTNANGEQVLVYPDYMDFLVYAGNGNPNVTGGLNFRVSYKGFSLQGLFSTLIGKREFLPNPYTSFVNMKIPDPTSNLSKELIYRWRTPGDHLKTNIPAIAVGGVENVDDPSGDSRSWDLYRDLWANSDIRVVNGSFLRMRQLSFSWFAPKRFATAMGMESLTISANVNNLFVIASSKYKGMDPETGTSKLPKTWSMGLTFSF